MGDQNNNNNKLNAAFFLLLQPIARLFLRYGRGFREYSDLSKAAFVAVAAADYGVHGRPTNASRIAAMTGLTRKEVSRIRQRIDGGDAAVTESGTPVKDVIAGWQSADEFLDDDGAPAALSLGAGRGSFRSLISQFAGDIPEGAMRKELQRIGAVELIGDTLRLTQTAPDSVQAEAQLARQLRAGPYPLLAALSRNEMAGAAGNVWPLETIGQKSIRKSDVGRVRKLVSVRLRAATTTIADLLDAYATLHAGEGADEAMVPVSAGAYYVEGLPVTEE